MENLFDLIDDLKKDLNDLEDLLEYLEQDPESTDLIKDIKEGEIGKGYIIFAENCDKINIIYKIKKMCNQSMDIVDDINKTPTNPSDKPLEDVLIESIEIIA